MVSKNKWKIPASIELEYAIPEGSDAVKEVRKCVEYLQDRAQRPCNSGEPVKVGSDRGQTLV